MTDALIKAKVIAVDSLAAGIVRVILEPERYVTYQAGQYLQLMVDGQPVSFSIANAPAHAGQYELHIRKAVDNPVNAKLFELLDIRAELLLHLPLGDCHLARLDPNKPIIFIAGGTGFAPIHAMIDALVSLSDVRKLELYWGVKNSADLYMESAVKQWHANTPHFSYHAKCSDGRKDGLAALVLEHHPHDLADWQIVISGPFDMVYQTRDQLVAHGAKRGSMYSDAFAFEP